MNSLTNKVVNLKNLKVEQFHNKNQFLIDLGGAYALQSYDSLVAIYDSIDRVLYLGENWDYSQTTRKHIYMFIEEFYPSLWSFLKEKNNKRKALQKVLDDEWFYEVKELKD